MKIVFALLAGVFVVGNFLIAFSVWVDREPPPHKRRTKPAKVRPLPLYEVGMGLVICTLVLFFGVAGYLLLRT